MKQRIVVVNKHIIHSNAKTGEHKEPLRMSNGKHGKPTYNNLVEFPGGRLIYDPDHPLPCGASVWLELDEVQ